MQAFPERDAVLDRGRHLDRTEARNVLMPDLAVDRRLTATSTLRNAPTKRRTGALPALCPNTLEIDGLPTTGVDFTSMPRFSPTDPVKALLYCSEAFVDLWFELIIGEDVGPVLFDSFPNQFADIERIDARGYSIFHHF